jgi:hypothetical protein
MTEQKQSAIWAFVGIAIMTIAWAYAVANFHAAQPKARTEVVEVIR